MIAWLLALLRGRPQRTCWVRCPSCRHDLNGDDASYLGIGEDETIVRYRCAACGLVSAWDFAAPVPLLQRARP